MRALQILAALAAVSSAVSAQPRPTKLDVIVASTTDVHGRLVGWDYYGGSPDSLRSLARAATVVDSLRLAHPGRVVLVDAGDLFQGNPLTYVAARVDTAGPHPVIAAMNAMRYDAAAVGNHEFNYGLPVLRSALRQARFPFLAANVTPLGTERRSPLFAPSRIVTRAGVRIAIVGATTPGAMVWDRENLANRLQITDIVPAVRRTVRRVRAQGVDVVVVVMHSGLDEASSYDTVATRLPSENVAARVAREVSGIDLLVFGHSHRELRDSTINGTLVMQPRNWAQSVGVATLTLERRAGRWRVGTKRGDLIGVAGRAEHQSVLAAVDRAHRATRAYVTQTVGSTRVRWSADSARVKDTPIIDFILEAQRRHTGADLSATAAFDLNAVIDSGPITIAEIARLYPYDNTLRAVRITGKQLREFLEFSARYYRQRGSPEAATSIVDPAVPGFNFDMLSGADYALDLSKPMGSRVTDLRVKGRPVLDGDQFTMALNNYRQTGGGGFAMLHGAPVVYDRQEEIRDVLIAEVRRRGDLRPEDVHTVNWRLLPSEVEGEAWRSMRSLPFDRSTGPRRPPPATSGEHLKTGRWLRIIGSNDFHGGILPRDFAGDGVVRGGAASFITALRAARAECQPPTCTSTWLDAGDQWQGTPESGLQLGRPVTDLFNRNGLTGAALGNHEFDWGLDSMRVRLRDNRFPVLAANIRDANGRPLPWLPGDTIVQVGGLRLGLIGVLTKETQRIVRASFLAGLQVLPAEAVIDSAVQRLRARGVDAVIVLAHIGAACERADVSACSGEAVELVQALTHRPDAMVLGHQHRPSATIVAGVPMVQAWQKGSGIGIIDLSLDGKAPVVALRSIRPDSIAGAPDVAAWADTLTRELTARMSQRLGAVADTLKRGAGRNFGDLVADAFRVAAETDIAVINAGATRVDLLPGPVTLGDAYAALPFGNQVVRFTLRGSELLAYLGEVGAMRVHFSGVDLEIDTTRAPRSRVTRARLLDGKPIDAAREYTLAMPDFVAEGAEGMQIGSRSVRTELLPILDRDALAIYLRRATAPVSAPREPRVKIRNP